MLRSGSGVRALLIAGEAGVGKTSVWTEGVAVARAAGQRVLRATPAEADSRRSFSGLLDLFDPIGDGTIARLPGPQRRALSMALLRTDPDPSLTPAETAVGPGVLGLLRLLAGRGPVLLAIDDLAWLDVASSAALAFAARRLGSERVRLLLARRAGGLSPFERDARSVPVERLDLGPLSLGATRQVIVDRLGRNPSRRTMRRLHEQSRGNPLFALELAALEGADDSDDAAPAAIPSAIDEALGARLDGLAPKLREVLLAVALTPTPSAAELTGLVGERRMQAAIRAGLIVVDGPRVRPGHPLLAEVAIARSGAPAIRAAHAALARVAADEDDRVRHLAAARTDPDADLATALESAAARASARRALPDAVDLAAESLRLTASGSAARTPRLLALAERMILAGEHRRAVELLRPAVATLPAGPLRAQARLLLSDASFSVTSAHAHEARAAFDAAIEDAATDPRLLAITLARRAHHDAIGPVTGLRRAEEHARQALAIAGDEWPDARAFAEYALGWTAHVRGRWPRGLTTRPHPADEPDLMRGLTRILAERQTVEGRVPEARERLERLLALADERGEAWSYEAIRLQLIELDLRAGTWDRVAELLDEWARNETLTSASGYERTRALREGGRGHGDEARRWAEAAVRHSEERGLGWDRLESLRALGLAEMAAGRPDRAVGPLRAVWDATRQARIVDPGMFPVAHELVEASLATGDVAAARHLARFVARFGRACR
ncbi:MAG TPA: AAA family ATPase, partial [Candidatus Limnocylindrales bacterium]